MIKQLLRKMLGTRNDRLLKQYKKIVIEINQLEPEMIRLTDSELQAKTTAFKNQLQQGATLDAILPEAFAVCREASKRVLNMRHFDVQLIGGIVLFNRKIAEMRTGEGKTLVATLPVYLNALTGDGVHVVTVNDYLANRDATEMGKLYKFLGLTVGVNLPDMSHEDKRLAYASDVTYGTNNEFGFDYLRDNMVFEINDKVQRGLNFAVVDEVDSILIDEARTPLIISGQAEGSDELYHKLNQLPNQLLKQSVEESAEGDFWVDEKNHNVVLSEAGHERVEHLLTEMGLLPVGDSLYSVHNIGLVHHLIAALKAHYVYLRDQHYVVQDGEVVIVDEFTGRLMSGRRWSDGLHQAVEAKEGVAIQRENKTMAAITFQNYFRMYKKLSGMTGTADTEAYEFQQIYGLETVVIPTNQPMIRVDYNDKIYMNLQDKYLAIVDDIQECNLRGQPILVGTTSVENSEVLSQLLTQAKLKHEVLNAKQHAREAEIIAQAGSIGAITVATNMAGRGTDIILGGSPKLPINKIENDSNLSDADKKLKIKEIMDAWVIRNQDVIAAGGLSIIGTERHESRRIDNQLRGRSGRQGDPGMSRFYLSLDDPLLRIFGGERMRSMMQRLGMKAGESIEHKWLSRSIESAQRKVEGHNFDIRKQLLEYDNVANDQRRVIYEQRDYILSADNLSSTTERIIEDVVGSIFDLHIPEKSMEEQWDIQELDKMLQNEFFINYSVADKLKQQPNIDMSLVKAEILALVKTKYLAKMAEFSNKINSDILQFIDGTLVGEDSKTWNIAMIEDFCLQNNIQFAANEFTNYVAEHANITRDEFKKYVQDVINDMGAHQVAKFERGILLQHIDHYWREHLTQLEQLREGIHLRGYAQKDPKREYQNEAFNLFSVMLDNIKRDVAKTLLVIKIQGLDDVPTDDLIDNLNHPNFIHQNAPSSFVLTGGVDGDGDEVGTQQIGSQQVGFQQVGRNAPCPCGSGKKYKHCHGRLA